MIAPRSLLLVGLAFTFAGCAGSGERPGFETDKPNPTEPADSKPAPSGDFGKQIPVPEGETPEVHEVYGQSATTLYKLEPKTKAVTVVGNFKNCEPVIDIALDEKSTLYAVSDKTLYTVDKNTAVCTPHGATASANAHYPTSLSFVPKGTVDPNEEALVGFDEGDYIRINVQDGSRTVLGKLGGSLVSSGDIVSVKGGKTFLTVKGAKGSDCYNTDCLVEVDPQNGKMLKNWGSIEHKKVFGLAFWGGKVYGFDEQGTLFEVTFGSNKVVTTTIPIPQKPADLGFWGAGSSTSAPLVAEPQ
jgi:hypothetical protein